MKNFKLVKTTAALALGASVVTAAVVPGTTSASAASKYKVTNGKLVNAKTGKVVKGYVVFKSKLYYNGKLKKGYKTVGSGKTIKLYYNGSLKKGYKTARNSKLLFFNGSLKKGYKSAGSGERLYKDGFLAKGYEVYGDVDKNPKLYYNGYLKSGYKTANNATLLFYNGELKKGYKTAKEGTVLYKDGRLNEGLVELNGVLYDGSKQNEGKKLFEGTLFDGAKRAIGLVKFEEKYYNDGVLANGEFVIDGEKVTIENGVLVGADKEAPVLKVDGETTITVENGAELKLPVVTATDNNDKEVEVKSVITDAEGKELKEIDTKVAGTYTVTYSAEDAAGNKAEDVVVTVVVKEAAFKVETVSAITTTTAKVTFASELKNDLTAADLTVKNKATGEKQVVKSVKIADDKKSATVEFYSELAANTTYTVDVKAGEETASAELVVGALTPTTIDVEDQIVKAGTPTDLKYTVKDADGVDITGKLPTGHTLYFKSASAAVNPETGVVNLDAGASIKVKVQVKKGTEVVAESKEVTVTAEAAVATTISAVTVHNGTADFTKPNTTAYGAGYYVEAQAKDQLGDVVEDATITYESQNLDVAVVDKNSGKITPVAETGTVPVKVSLVVGDKTVATKTVNVEIKAPQKASAIAVAEKTALLSNKFADSKLVKVNVADQYGTAIAAEQVNDSDLTDNVEVFAADGKTPSTQLTAALTQGTVKGEYNLTLDTTDASEAGDYIVKVYAAADKKVATEVKVTVKVPGAAKGYVIKDVPTEFDLAKASGTPTGNAITPKLWTADADGLAVAQSTDVEFSVDNKAVTIATNGSSITAIDASQLKAGDTFTITATVGPNKVATQKVTVVDSTTKYAADFTQYTVPATAATGLTGALTGKVTVKANGKAVEGLGDVTAVNVVSTDSNVIAANGTITAPAADTTVVVLVKSITIEIAGQATPITFDTPVKLTVKVAAKVAE